MYQLQYFQFPKDFIFGTADADLQVIGEEHTLKNENSLPTMWNHFAQSSPEVYKNQTPMSGIDRYHLWKEDIALMKELGLRHYRTSISMARIMDKNRKPNMKAIDWYKTFFEELRKNEIAIYATIYHWELPQFLSEKGGWKNRDTAQYVADHSLIAHKYLGDYIEEYFILNEPVQSTFYSYHIGEQAPGERDLKGALAAVHHTLLAQGLTFRALKSADKNVKLSTVFNPSVTYAASSSQDDIKSAQYAFGYHTGMFTDPTYLGKYPDYMLELFEGKMPQIQSGDMETIKIDHGLHSFGVNFYRGKITRYNPISDVRFEEVRYPQGVKNGMGRPVYIPPTYPEGLYDILCELYYRYHEHGMKQIYITENGASWPDTLNEKGEVDDEFRIFYLREHLKQVEKAILKGVPVKGFFQWTFMDNFNWSAGYRPESVYGLVHVDFETMKRTPKKSFYWYKDLLESHRLP
ncbi:MAG: family 1 glycosylhydrolase [Candidatus Levybacteria bacterium]|nr:family 1 glycosylhydrolase [Candidatus Levybacteria bacterium]